MASNNPPSSSIDSSPSQNQSSDDPHTELTAQLDDLLNTLSNKFAGVSSEIFAKMDEMSRRLDNIEATLRAKEDSK